VLRTLRPLAGENWPLLAWGALAAVGAVVFFVTRRGETTHGTVKRQWPMWAGALLGTRQALPFLYAFFGLASTVVQMGYVGGNYNHLLDGLLPLCIVLGLSVAWPLQALIRDGRGYRIAAVAGLAAALIAVGTQIFLFNPPRTWYRGGWPSAALDADIGNLSRLVRDTPGDLYSEDATILLVNGKRVLYDDPSTFVPLAEKGVWDGAAFTQAVRDRRFPLFILQQNSGRMTEGTRQALEESYTLKFRSLHTTYEARIDPPTPQFALNCTLSQGMETISRAGYALGPGVAHTGIAPGRLLYVTLYWRPAARPAHDYASFVHVLNERGERVAGTDNPRTAAPQPTSAWPASETVRDIVAVPLPDDLPPGRHRLIAGMYRLDAGNIIASQPACTGSETFGTAGSLGWIEVK
jgi:hypothetical protein